MDDEGKGAHDGACVQVCVFVFVCRLLDDHGGGRVPERGRHSGHAGLSTLDQLQLVHPGFYLTFIVNSPVCANGTFKLCD